MMTNSLRRALQLWLPSRQWSSGKSGAPTWRISWMARSIVMTSGTATARSSVETCVSRPRKRTSPITRLVVQAGMSLTAISTLPIHTLENAAGRKVKKLSAGSRDRGQVGPGEDPEKFNLLVKKTPAILRLRKKNKRKLKRKKNNLSYHSKQKKFTNLFLQKTPTTSSLWRLYFKIKEAASQSLGKIKILTPRRNLFQKKSSDFLCPESNHIIFRYF